MAFLDFNLFARGGPMIWVLLALGLLGVMLFVERTLYLHRGQIRSTAFVAGIKNILAKRRLVEALTVCEETPVPVAAIAQVAPLRGLLGTVLGFIGTFQAFEKRGDYVTASELSKSMWQALLAFAGSLILAIPEI